MDPVEIELSEIRELLHNEIDRYLPLVRLNSPGKEQAERIASLIRQCRRLERENPDLGVMLNQLESAMEKRAKMRIPRLDSGNALLEQSGDGIGH